MSHPSKVKGYRAEVRVADALRRMGVHAATRTGSVGQVPGGPDVVNAFADRLDAQPILVLALVTPREPIMFVLDERSMQRLLREVPAPGVLPIYVQVKRRGRFAVTAWFNDLVDGVKRWRARYSDYSDS